MLTDGAWGGPCAAGDMAAPFVARWYCLDSHPAELGILLGCAFLSLARNTRHAVE